MSSLDPGLMNIPPDLQMPDRDIFFSPVSEIGDLTGHCGFDPASSAAVSHPSHSPTTDDQSMEVINPALNKSKSDLEAMNRDFQNRSVTDIARLSGFRGSIPASHAAIHPPQFSFGNLNSMKEAETNICSINRKLEFCPESDDDGFAGFRDSLQATDAPNPIVQCSSDNAQTELKNSL